MVVHSDRFGSALLGDINCGLFNGAREVALTSREQDAQETHSSTYLWPPSCATRGWLTAVPWLSVRIGTRLESASLAVIRVS